MFLLESAGYITITKLMWKKRKEKKRKKRSHSHIIVNFFSLQSRPHCSPPSFLPSLFFLSFWSCGDQREELWPGCPSNYVWSPDGGGGAGQPGWTRKCVSLWRNITLTIYSPGLLLAFTNNFTNSASSLEIIFLTTNFRENISDALSFRL